MELYVYVACVSEREREKNNNATNAIENDTDMINELGHVVSMPHISSNKTECFPETKQKENRCLETYPTQI